MRCPVCGEKSIVVLSATFPDEIIYLRECKVCKQDFYTAERDIDRKEGYTLMCRVRCKSHLKPKKRAVKS